MEDRRHDGPIWLLLERRKTLMILQDTSSSSYLINNPDPLAPNDYPEPILPTANMLKSGNFRNAFFHLTFPFFISSISSLPFLIEYTFVRGFKLESSFNNISSSNILCPQSPLMEFNVSNLIFSFISHLTSSAKLSALQ